MKNKFRSTLQIIALLSVAVVLLFLNERSERSGASDAPKLSSDRYASFMAERNAKRPFRPYHQLLVYNPEKSYPGYTLAGLNNAEEVMLFTHDGKIHQSWPIDSDRSILIKDSCSLVATHGTVNGASIAPWKALRYALREYDFEGNLAWEYINKDLFHHDVRELEGGQLLSLVRRNVPYRGGLAFKEGFEIKADGFLVVNKKGQETFSWHSEEHLSHDFCGIRPCPTVEVTEASRVEFKRRKDWTHANTVSMIPENPWFENGDSRFRPGNFLIHIRNFWMSYVIDAQTKEVVWRFPEPEEFEADPSLRIFGGHESHMITPGLPGAGNILIFDNGNDDLRPYTRILEIDPIRRQIVWSYQDPDRFYSRTAGAVQRLPNGNTLISEDLRGRVFEITTDGEIVWELRTPYRTARARRYPLDWCE